MAGMRKRSTKEPGGARASWEWERWEARRAKPPPGLDPDVREARQDARLLLQVVRFRLQEGSVPVEHLPALNGVASDGRVQVRRRRVAAELAAVIRLGALDEARAGSVPRGA